MTPPTDAEKEAKKAEQEALWKERDVLIMEYERLCGDIRSIEAMNTRVVGLGLTVIGTGFAYALREDRSVTFIFLPVLLYGVFFFAALQYYDVYWMGGYKRSIENRINALSGKILLQWETLIETKRKRANLYSLSLMSVYFTILVFGIGTSIVKIYIQYGAVAGALQAALMAVLAGVLFLAGTRMMDAYDIAFLQSETLFARTPSKLTASTSSPGAA